MSLADQVHKMFGECLFTDEELKGGNPEKFVGVHGLTMNVGFHPERLEAQREGVKEVLKQMQPQFFKQTGGGWSFLNLCMAKDGEQWAEQMTCQELVLLAMGLKLASYPLPREVWSALPGGVPYIVFDLDGASDVKAEHDAASPVPPQAGA